jgi:hypothetical protein
MQLPDAAPGEKNKQRVARRATRQGKKLFLCSCAATFYMHAPPKNWTINHMCAYISIVHIMTLCALRSSRWSIHRIHFFTCVSVTDQAALICIRIDALLVLCQRDKPRRSWASPFMLSCLCWGAFLKSRSHIVSFALGYWSFKQTQSDVKFWKLRRVYPTFRRFLLDKMTKMYRNRLNLPLWLAYFQRFFTHIV